MSSTAEASEKLYTSLRDLGLSETAAQLYLASLSLGPSTIRALATRLGIARPNLYALIRGLDAMGLVRFAERKKYARDFMVEPPTVVLEKLREKKAETTRREEALTAVMPDLLGVYRQGAGKTKIRILEGEAQFRHTFQMILEEAKGGMSFFGSFSDFIAFVEWGKQRPLIRARVRKGIRVRALLLPSHEAEIAKAADARELRETRILKDMHAFIASFQLFANKVILWQPKAPLAVVIEDEYIVAMLQSTFDALWERSA